MIKGCKLMPNDKEDQCSHEHRSQDNGHLKVGRTGEDTGDFRVKVMIYFPLLPVDTLVLFISLRCLVLYLYVHPLPVFHR